MTVLRTGNISCRVRYIMNRILLPILLFIFSCEELLDADITAPTVVITYPVNGAVLSQTETVKVDVADSGDITSVKFLIDGTEVSADNTVPYEYQWDTYDSHLKED